MLTLVLALAIVAYLAYRQVSGRPGEKTSPQQTLDRTQGSVHRLEETMQQRADTLGREHVTAAPSDAE